uniref:Uncharacterized protein n=1 Tax=Arundo donax TaxID=35708 RepID=A0A0A8YCK9_ARUDO
MPILNVVENLEGTVFPSMTPCYRGRRTYHHSPTQ